MGAPGCPAVAVTVRVGVRARYSMRVVDWYNHRRLHGELSLIPPAEYETNHWASTALEYYPDNRVPAGAGTN